MAEVLVVDDDLTVREVVVSYLRAGGHEVQEAGDGEAALRAMRGRGADLVVLDLMLPGVDGLEVCRQLRESSDVPIIMLTALGAETDRLVGLRLGADDYVTKPFSPRELALRVDSVLRRVGQRHPKGATVIDGDLVVEPAEHTATLGGSVLPLTVREFDLLHFLVANPRQAWSRDALLREVWGWSFGDQSTVTVHVRRLREKVETDPRRPVRLLTVWGVGYRWEPQ
ncbi:response regulator transcription factor [Pedococcus sp. KACC 23699]|uniref:Response regulator transcription factor n=1 Tax=Pedococcus sp. KACC 23699 TaxID=3149228 RepID=A0AAU7JQD6_9MICO